MIRILVSLALFASCAPPLFAQGKEATPSTELRGIAVGVPDANTVVVFDRSRNGTFRVRLRKIEVPRSDEALTKKAKAHLLALCHEKKL